MIFIFPKNYKFNNKFLGSISYFTILFNVIWQLFIYCLINLIFKNITFKISLFIILCFPILILSLFEISNETIFVNLFYLFKFIISPKLYLFNKL